MESTISAFKESVINLHYEQVHLRKLFDALPANLKQMLKGTPDDCLTFLHDSAVCLDCVIEEIDNN